MSVYVDQMMVCIPNKNWHHSENCHMYADTREELVAFAVRLGLKEKWIQEKASLVHFDLTENMRRKAVRMGAVEHSHEDTSRFIKLERLRRAAPEIACLHVNDGHMWKPMRNELQYCTRCMACEGGTPTHCPGKRMSNLQQEAVYQGDIDFRDGRWWAVPTVHMAHAYGFRRHGKVVRADRDGHLNIKGRGTVHMLNNIRYGDIQLKDFVYVLYDTGRVFTGLVASIEYASPNGNPATTVGIVVRELR